MLYKVDQIVQIWNQRKWATARLQKYEPYIRRAGTIPGWRYTWYPLPKTDPVTGISPSIAGWASEHIIRVNH